jgi:hypothetical protein
MRTRSTLVVLAALMAASLVAMRVGWTRRGPHTADLSEEQA